MFVNTNVMHDHNLYQLIVFFFNYLNLRPPWKPAFAVGVSVVK